MFDASQPSVQALSYFPLKVVAAEWVNYISAMCFALRPHEADNISDDLLAELDKLSLSLKVLQAWSRRALTGIEKINQMIRFIRSNEALYSVSEDWRTLCEDFELIRTGIQEHASRFESMVPVATSFIQLIESRRALRESANVTRLTFLATFFLPLSYVASLFSMGERYGPDGIRFWVYFAVALPITLCTFFFAKAPSQVRSLSHWWDQVRHLWLLRDVRKMHSV